MTGTELLFDTHAHVHGPEFDADRDSMLARARDAGVGHILTIGTDLADSRLAQSTAHRYELDYAVGIHPHEALDAPSDVATALAELVDGGARPPRAIGEIGLDYYYDRSPRDVQRDVLITQLRFAERRGLPVIFHQRDAFDDFVTILRSVASPALRGVVHCFTGDVAQAKLLVGEFGLFLGIGGVATFKNAQSVRDAVVAVGLERIVLETDCPYLAPVPHRGKRNEPAFITSTAGRLAELFATTPEAIARRTTATARALFGP